MGANSLSNTSCSKRWQASSGRRGQALVPRRVRWKTSGRRLRRRDQAEVQS
jgi:hypothetical protein